MNNIIGPTYSSSLFAYAKETKRFIGEISMTPGVLRQLWNDSMDLGFGIRSHKTGKVVYFTLTDVHYDREGEVQGWSFEVFNPHDLENLRGLNVVILND